MSELYNINVQLSGTGLLNLTEQLRVATSEARILEGALKNVKTASDAIPKKIKTYTNEVKDAFSDYEQALNEMKIALPTDSLSKLDDHFISEHARSLSEKYGAKENVFLEMVPVLISKGIKPEGLQETMTIAAKLKLVLPDKTHKEAATLVAQAMRSAGASAKNSGDFMDRLFRTKNLPQIVDAFKRAKCSLKEFGLQGTKVAKELVPTFKLLSANFGSGMIAGNAFSNALKSSHNSANIEAANALLKGSSVQLKFMNQTGQSLGMENFMQQLDKLKNIKDKQVQLQVLHQLFGEGKSFDVAKILMKKGSAGITAEDTKLNNQVSLDGAVDVKVKELGTALQRQEGAFTSLLQTIGGLYEGMFKIFANSFANILYSIKNLISSHQLLSTIFISLGALIFGIIPVAKTLKGIYQNVKTGWDTLKNIKQNPAETIKTFFNPADCTDKCGCQKDCSETQTPIESNDKTDTKSTKSTSRNPHSVKKPLRKTAPRSKLSWLLDADFDALTDYRRNTSLPSPKGAEIKAPQSNRHVRRKIIESRYSPSKIDQIKKLRPEPNFKKKPVMPKFSSPGYGVDKKVRWWSKLTSRPKMQWKNLSLGEMTKDLEKLSGTQIKGLSKVVRFSFDGGEVTKGIQSLSGMATKASGLFRILGLVMKGALIGSGIGTIALGIAVAGVLIYQHWDKVQGLFMSLWEFIQPTVQPLLDFVFSIANGINSLFGWTADNPTPTSNPKAKPKAKVAEEREAGVSPPVKEMRVPNERTFQQRAQRSASQGKQIAVTYSPTIHFSGAMSEKDRNSFRDMLRKHKDEILRLVQSAEQRQTALAY